MLLLGTTRGQQLRSVALFALALAGAVDATLVEPYALDVQHETRAVRGLRHPVTVAHLSDLHTHGFGRHEQRVVELVRAAKPDLIVVTGDVVDEGTLEPARDLFMNLHAPLGVWVVRGNWENWRPPPGERAFYASVGATFLLNEGKLARDDLYIAGTDDLESGAPDLAAALRAAPPLAMATRVALFHSPAELDAAATGIDLAFAGHTHGGQVRLPFLPPLWLPPGSGRYVEGWYTSGRAAMFVSRGIGTSVLPIRFFCPPQIEVATLTPP